MYDCICLHSCGDGFPYMTNIPFYVTFGADVIWLEKAVKCPNNIVMFKQDQQVLDKRSEAQPAIVAFSPYNSL